MANRNSKPQFYDGKQFESIKAVAEYAMVSHIYLAKFLRDGLSIDEAIEKCKNRPSQPHKSRYKGKHLTPTYQRSILYTHENGTQIYDFDKLSEYLKADRDEVELAYKDFGSVTKVIEYFKKRGTVDQHALKINIINRLSDIIFDAFLNNRKLGDIDRDINASGTLILPPSVSNDLLLLETKRMTSLLIELSKRISTLTMRVLGHSYVVRGLCDIKRGLSDYKKYKLNYIILATKKG